MNALPGNSREVAALIDHTLLKPEATRKDIERLCNEGLQHQFASVCVNPVFTDQVAEALEIPRSRLAWWWDFRWGPTCRPQKFTNQGWRWIKARRKSTW